ncbi:MAG: hypothetical protein BGO68_03750 [Candidatus Amoebophilus sp. 36-38]|nr:MAG: hypothetical protein BGO68_03750 [Candidatus Amoebophilus sp. 36-38]
MLRSRKIIALMGFLFLNIFAISCGCGKDDSKEDEEKKKLVAEEKKLVEDFSKKFLLSSDQTKSFEAYLQKSKNEDNVQDISELIELLKKFKTSLDSTESILLKASLSGTNAFLQKLMPGFTPVIDPNRGKDILEVQIQIWGKIRQQVELKNKGKK